MGKAANKKVLFHYPIMNLGGAEMSIIRLTRALVESGWDVELVLTTGGGLLEDAVDPGVKVSRLRSRSAGNRFVAAGNLLNRLLCLDDLFWYGFYRFQGMLKSFLYMFKKYDVAVVSLHGMSPYFCCKVVNAEKRIHWIRNDLSLGDPDGKADKNIKKYQSKIDNYICVSGTAHNSLVEKYPFLRSKAFTVHNILAPDEMREKSQLALDPFRSYGETLKVVTVCRLSDKAKGLTRMLNIHKRLEEEGIDFYWFVVGDGPDKPLLMKKIFDINMENRFILLGKKGNPFPYYKYADISATLSYFEGLSGAVNEAKVMGKPVIATEFSGIREQIVDGENGIVVDNDEAAIYEGMKRMLCDEQLRKKLTNDYLPDNIYNDRKKISILEEIFLS